MSGEVTVTGLTELTRELELSIIGAIPGAYKVVSKGSLNVKNAWKKSWTGIAHAPRIPTSISYDMTSNGFGISSEIGPEDDAYRQGFLGAVLEFGGLHSPPVPGGLPALADEEPKFLVAVEALSKDLLP